MSTRTFRRHAYSVAYLLGIAALVGTLAALAMPRRTQASTHHGHDVLSANLTTIRSAILHYATEHRNTFPGPDAEAFVKQLTLYSDVEGNTSLRRDAQYRFGPYLIELPPCAHVAERAPVWAAEVLISDESPPRPVAAVKKGWVYNPRTGELMPNLPGGGGGKPDTD